MESLRLIQFETKDGARRVGTVRGAEVVEVRGVARLRELALAAIAAGQSLSAHARALGEGARHDYDALKRERRVLVPLDHEDPAHCLVSGTGLTHLGSAATRDRMHQKVAGPETTLTDTMRIFKWGVEGGKPAPGSTGVQPEWFYKGDGSILVRPGEAFPVPAFAEDAGEEPEIVGLYVVAPDGRPWRLGYALGNEFSDHVMERRNYLYLAHSKLRPCSVGPELRTGELPAHLLGTSRIRRRGKVLWEQTFLSGEDNMCHSIANLEHHHFKYRQFLRPGDVHLHFFGTATLSFADGVSVEEGDEFEIACADFGAPLVNGVRRLSPAATGSLQAL